MPYGLATSRNDMIRHDKTLVDMLDTLSGCRHQNGSTFCVVPIIAASDQPLPATYDFWVGGKDCCTNLGEDFHCGAAAADSKAGSARGGLRPGHRSCAARMFQSGFYIRFEDVWNGLSVKRILSWQKCFVQDLGC